MTLLEEAEKIYADQHGGEVMHSRQIKALALAAERRLNDLEERLTNCILRAVSSETPTPEREG